MKKLLLVLAALSLGNFASAQMAGTGTAAGAVGNTPSTGTTTGGVYTGPNAQVTNPNGATFGGTPPRNQGANTARRNRTTNLGGSNSTPTTPDTSNGGAAAGANSPSTTNTDSGTSY